MPGTKLEEWRNLVVKDPTRVPQTLRNALSEACDRIEELEAKNALLEEWDASTRANFKLSREAHAKAEAKVKELEARIRELEAQPKHLWLQKLEATETRLKAAEAVCEAARECDEYLCDDAHWPRNQIGARSQLHHQLAASLKAFDAVAKRIP